MHIGAHAATSKEREKPCCISTNYGIHRYTYFSNLSIQIHQIVLIWSTYFSL